MRHPLRRTAAVLVAGIALGSALLAGQAAQAAGHSGGFPLADNSGPVIPSDAPGTAAG